MPAFTSRSICAIGYASAVREGIRGSTDLIPFAKVTRQLICRSSARRQRSRNIVAAEFILASPPDRKFRLCGVAGNFTLAEAVARNARFGEGQSSGVSRKHVSEDTKRCGPRGSVVRRRRWSHVFFAGSHRSKILKRNRRDKSHNNKGDHVDQDLLLPLIFAVTFGASRSDDLRGDPGQRTSDAWDRSSKTARARTRRMNAGLTPLMYAAVVGSADAMRVLIDAGADVNAKNAFGSTALMWSVTDFKKVKMLVEHGANVNAASKAGRTALLLAASVGQVRGNRPLPDRQGRGCEGCGRCSFHNPECGDDRERYRNRSDLHRRGRGCECAGRSRADTSDKCGGGR